MKLLSSHFVAPAILALSALVGCSSDSPAGGNNAGASPGGASGKAGSAGSSAAGSGTAGSAAAGASAAGAGGQGAAGSAGASTAGSGGAAIEASFAMVKDMIALTCFGNGCHSQEGNPLLMKIDDKLYGIVTTHMTMNCGKLVNTASPADSALVKVLMGDCGPMPRTPANTTPRMPWDKCFDGDVDSDFCVAPAKVAAIQAWIAKGAPQ